MAVAPSTIPRADPFGTVVALAGLAISAIALNGRSASEVAYSAAVGVGVSLALSVAFDLRHGLRNLVRADLLALASFYFLTLFEFFFPQPDFNLKIDAAGTRVAVHICLWGFAGLLVGRHLSRSSKQPLAETMTRPVPQIVLLGLFWGCLFLGFFHMIYAVHFNFLEMIDFFLAPRFAQPWGRGRLGDWKALLVELAMLLYLVPPLAGIIFARRQGYSWASLFGVAAGLIFLLFYGFTSGTRYLFHSFIITFVIGYAFGSDLRRRTELFIVCGIAAVMVLASTVLMLKFREVGLKNYWQGKRWESEEPTERTLSVDVNLYSIACLARVFPAEHSYIGLEVPYLALIRPIPRAVWPDKPEGMSTSIEDAVGAGSGWTVAATFAGEAYMSGGILAVIGIGMFFGYLTAWWNRLSSPQNSQFGILIYASGFFCAVISMRSLFFFTTAMLPTLSAIIAGRFLLAKGADRLRMNTRRGQTRPARRRPVPAAR